MAAALRLVVLRLPRSATVFALGCADAGGRRFVAHVPPAPGAAGSARAVADGA
jgi:hypothetical protein